MTVQVGSQPDGAPDVTRREEIEQIEEMIERLEGWRIRVANSHADATALLQRLIPNEAPPGLAAAT